MSVGRTWGGGAIQIAGHSIFNEYTENTVPRECTHGVQTKVVAGWGCRGRVNEKRRVVAGAAVCCVYIIVKILIIRCSAALKLRGRRRRFGRG